MKVIGIDPDCHKSGLAVYEDGKLTGLLSLTTSEYMKMLYEIREDGGIVIAIEDPNLISGMYARSKNSKDTRAVKDRKAMAVGAIKRQAAIMIELAEYHGIKCYSYKPTKANFERYKSSAADNCKRLFDATGWDGDSNPETRSAAFFGHLHIKRKGG